MNKLTIYIIIWNFEYQKCIVTFSEKFLTIQNIFKLIVMIEITLFILQFVNGIYITIHNDFVV